MQNELQILIKPDEMRAAAQKMRRDGKRLAFVPTMGALHAGHMSLVRRAADLADHVIVSIFVNPLQFGPKEDFARYPRTTKEDVALLQSAGVSALFLPNAADIYPENFQTRVINEQMADDLCGQSRPGHFAGVLTVVNKMFNIVGPDIAVFGKKDYQQWRLIERMVRDLCMPLAVVGVETEREADGLAMSSRNRYLDESSRAKAVVISQSLRAAAAKFVNGERHARLLEQEVARGIAAVESMSVEYIALRKQHDLAVFGDMIDAPAVILLAVRLGHVRLLDNWELNAQ